MLKPCRNLIRSRAIVEWNACPSLSRTYCRCSPSRLDLRSLSRIAALALAAVNEDENARLSYRALKHFAPEPDFHHPDTFALELA